MESSLENLLSLYRLKGKGKKQQENNVIGNSSSCKKNIVKIIYFKDQYLRKETYVRQIQSTDMIIC